MLQMASHSAIALQSWNAAGDEVPLRTQFLSSVISACSQKAYISIKISIVAAVRAWPNPVTTHTLCYLSPSLVQDEAVWGLSQSLVEGSLQWSHSQERSHPKSTEKIKRGEQEGSKTQ